MSQPAEAPAEQPGESLAPGTLLAGRFRIERPAGSGGMGKVYKAFDTLLERFVALKSILSKQKETPAHMERFRQEALALAQLNHPGICQLYDLVATEHGSFLAMEWVEGRTLDQAAATLELKDKLLVLLQIAEGLEIAHGKGMAHRDLKPLNLMVDQNGRVKILDFGLARFATMDKDRSVSQADHLFKETSTVSALPVSDSDLSTGSHSALTKRVEIQSDQFTRLGFFMGSPRYASPEQIRGELAGIPSDIFSFGIVMWELLLNEHPYPGLGREQLKAVIENQRKHLRSRLPKPLAKLLERMLSILPEDRPTASQIIRVFRKQLRPRRSRGLLLAASLLLLGSLVYGIVWFTLPMHSVMKTFGFSRQQELLLWTFENGDTEGWHGISKWEASCSLSKNLHYVTEGRYALKVDCTGSIDWNQDIAINDGPFPKDIRKLVQLSVDVTAPESSLAGMEYQEIFLVFIGQPNNWYEIKKQFHSGKQTITFEIDNAQIKQDVWHVYFVLNSSQPFKGPIYLDRIIGKTK